MKTQVIKDILGKNNITQITENTIELCYDLGDSADAEHFENTFEDILRTYLTLEASLDIFEDPAYADSDDDEFDFHVGSVIIEYSNENDLHFIKEFLDEIDTI